jgi:CcmD family protein
MIIVVGIWLGLYVYLFRLDGRIRKLEKESRHES